MSAAEHTGPLLAEAFSDAHSSPRFSFARRSTPVRESPRAVLALRASEYRAARHHPAGYAFRNGGECYARRVQLLLHRANVGWQAGALRGQFAAAILPSGNRAGGLHNFLPEQIKQRESGAHG